MIREVMKASSMLSIRKYGRARETTARIYEIPVIIAETNGLRNHSKPFIHNGYRRGASRNRTTDTWIFSTMLYTMYQALTGLSDQIETISVSQFVPVCPVMLILPTFS